MPELIWNPPVYILTLEPGTNHIRILSEAVGITDAAKSSSGIAYNRILSESVGVTDSADGLLYTPINYVRTLAEAIGISDSVQGLIEPWQDRSTLWNPMVYILPSRIYVSHVSDLLMPFYLFELNFASPLYYTDTDITVVWSGNAYQPLPISVGGLGKSNTNFSETLTIQTHNVDRAVAAIILNETIQGKQANIYRSAWMNPGSYSNPVVVFKGQFDGVQIAEGYDTADVTLEVKNDFVRWDMSVPRANFAGVCQWKFKSNTPGCQYTGVASLCNKTWERCDELANTHRFRGFRWLPMLQDKEIWWGRNPPA